MYEHTASSLALPALASGFELSDSLDRLYQYICEERGYYAIFAVSGLSEQTTGEVSIHLSVCVPVFVRVFVFVLGRSDCAKSVTIVSRAVWLLPLPPARVFSRFGQTLGRQGDSHNVRGRLFPSVGPGGVRRVVRLPPGGGLGRHHRAGQ